MKTDFNWVYFVSKRLSSVDKKGRTKVTSRLASIGVCFGVMALIVVMSVMNGFQMSFIDAIMEITSSHVRIIDVQNSREDISEWLLKNQSVNCFNEFYEAQGLLVSRNGRQSAAIVRAVPQDLNLTDKGFAKELKIVAGHFGLNNEESIVLGNTLADNLKVAVGSTINIAALSGSSDVSLLSQNRTFKVTGIFYSEYAALNANYAFVSLDSGKKNFGEGAKLYYSVKLKDSKKDSSFIHDFKNNFSQVEALSFREFNRSFFGTLRLEKNVLFLLLFLIFIVVAINIYNGMKRLVYERKDDIAVLSAMGASSGEIQNIFIFQGALIGLKGAVPGLALGVFISLNIKAVFILLSKIQYGLTYIFYWIFNRGFLSYVTENPMFSVYAQIPARMKAGEITVIFVFGVLSALVSSWLASRGIFKLTVTEVLRNE